MMPGTFRFSGGSEDVSKPQPPPVAPRVTVQSWQPTPVAPLDGSLNMYGNHVRSGSVDSLDSSSGSSVSSSSSSGSHTRQHSGDSGEFIPTRTLSKNPSVPAYNPLQFVKVQSPLYRKAEQQIKLAKEVKIARETLKEGEEEWQSNLDNWKSRRRKASERVFQRAEEMRQIEAEEQLRQHQQQQRRIKTFSEIVEKRSLKKHNYNFDLYVGQGDDSGLGATPEPEDQDSSLDNLNSTARSDVSEDVTSESESIDSDARCSEKTIEKEPPEVPKKPYSWLSKKNQCAEAFKMNNSAEEILNSSLQHKEIFHVDNPSSAEPSDIEGHAGDIETLSSEDDAGYCGPGRNVDSGLESLSDSHRICDVPDSASDFSQDSCTGLDKANHDTDPDTIADDRSDVKQDRKDVKVDCSEETSKGEGHEINFKLILKQSGDSKGFGFCLKGGKDQSSKAYVDSISPGSAAEVAGLLVGDVILSINGEKTCSNSHSSLVFAVKQAVYIGQLDLVIWRCTSNGTMIDEIKKREEKESSQKKGSSFADKIAMFSNGVNSHAVPCPPPVAPRTCVSLSKATKSEELKKESLVLRRKSAFECSPAGDQVKKRWSSCVSSENSVSSKLTNGERRHSIDFTKPADKLAHINSTSKKAPPPPVPVKPKVKSRVQNSENNTSCDEVNRNKVDVSVDQSGSRRCELNVEGKNEYPVNISKLDSVVSVPNGQEHIEESQCTESSHLYEQSVNINALSSHSESVEKTAIVSDQVANNIESSPDLEISPSSPGNTVLLNIPESPDHSCEDQHFESLRNLSAMHSSDTQATEVVIPPEDGLLISDERAKIPVEDELTPLVTESNISNTSAFSLEKTDSISDIDESSYLSNNEHSSPSESGKDIFSNQTVYTESSSDQTLSFEDDENNSPVDSANITENTFSTEDSSIQLRDVEHMLDHPVVVDPDTNCEERDSHVEINVPPLCLTLEKIDEDDVVSASTTTSSETPDTETVIEHFPSNVSPLPNDDVISENLNIEPRDSSFDLSVHTVTVPATENSLLPMENSMPESNDETSNQSITVPASGNEIITECEHVESSFVEVESTSHFRETFSRSQDDDVPLTEDVIDEIEMRLMQQLEQQGELEDMSADQDEPLEDEVNRQLMYLSDDADLLEDLDAPPRHVVPPSEPPPPPPPPEMEAEENKTPPLMRVNSTKRIKKEMYRRRSDFLGLDSGEGIDIDNIPPRPPGLEELYKSEMEIEREQRLWLEKRLSLAEPLPEEMSSFDAPTSVNLNSDYTYYPNNMPEVLDAEVYDAVSNEYTTTEKEVLKEACPAEENFLPQSPMDSLEKVIPENPPDNENTSPGESPQHKAKQHIQSLGAAPRAKIMDSDKWITQAEKNPTSKRRSVDPVLQENRGGTQNFWLAQEAEKRNSFQRMNPQPQPQPQSHNVVDRRYSMPPAYGGSRQHPDVTVRTWGDRELPYQQRPKSAIWDASSRSTAYDPYLESCYSGYSGASRVPLSHSQYETQAYSQRHPIDLRRCSYCREELTDGSAMGIEALQLYFHIECFHCCVCGLQLGNGSCGTDVQVKNNQLYCPSCFTLD